MTFSVIFGASAPLVLQRLGVLLADLLAWQHDHQRVITWNCLNITSDILMDTVSLISCQFSSYPLTILPEHLAIFHVLPWQADPAKVSGPLLSTVIDIAGVLVACLSALLFEARPRHIESMQWLRLSWLSCSAFCEFLFLARPWEFGDLAFFILDFHLMRKVPNVHFSSSALVNAEGFRPSCKWNMDAI